MENFKKTVIMGLLGFILMFAITMQFKLANTNESSTTQSKKTDKLKDQIFLLNEENKKNMGNMEKYEKELENIRDEVSKNDIYSSEKSELIKKYTIFSGQTDAEGQGIILKYYPYENQYISDIARDLRDLINELKNAGIEAISINNERLIDISAIEMVKNVIEINNREVKAPYTIKAIGNKDVIYNSLLRPMGEIEVIKDTGVKIDIQKSEKVKINKYK